MKERRPLFTDGWNSFFHVYFGGLGFAFWAVIPNFIIYQLIDYYDVNLFIDLGEFFIGLVFVWILVTTYERIYNNKIE
jgi:hypothetical protein